MEGIGLIAGANAVQLSRGHSGILGKSNWAQNVNMVAQRKIKWLSWNDGLWCCLLEKGVLVWSSRTSPCRTKLKRATEVAVGDDWTCELPKRLQLGHSNQS